MKDFPLYRTPRAAVIGVLVLALPLVLLSLSPLGGLYAVMAVVFLLPTAACMAGLIGGALPMTLAAAAGLYAMQRVAGPMGLTLAAVYVLPILLAFVLVVSLRVPFLSACFTLIGVHVAALAACYLLLQQWTGGELYTAAGIAAANALDKWELGSTMLYHFYSSGLIDLPEDLRGTALIPVLGGYMLSPAARSDLLLSVRGLVSDAMASLIPNLIVTQSILGGVGCLLLPLRFGSVAAQRRAVRAEAAMETKTDANGGAAPSFPDLGMPPFETWHLPRGIGWQVGLALVAGYVLRASSSAPVAVAGVILYSAAHAVFTIQGAALVNYMQKARGRKRFWRVAVPLALMLLSVLMFLGVMDQISNIRRLRKPREPKEDMRG